MAETLPALQAPGIAVYVRPQVAAAALRYFEPCGDFAAAAGAAGAPLPQVLRAREEGELILAWRSPSETMCVAASAARLADLARAMAGRSDGCCVELTGGVTLMRLSGERTRDLMCRIGSSASMPEPGEALRSRIAEVPVLAVSLRAQEVLLIVDRLYAEHLLGWIRETLLDFT